jgi:OOP family OmpA-OmpF porin
MAINVLDLARNVLTDNVIKSASNSLGESEIGIKKAISGILPSVLVGLVSKSRTLSNGGLTSLLESSENLLRTESASHSDSLAGIFSNSQNLGVGSSLLGSAAPILSTLFGDRHETVANGISNFSGIRSSSASTLLSVISPVVLRTIGNYASSNRLDEKGIWSWLSTQKDAILSAIPGGLDLSALLGIGSLGSAFASFPGFSTPLSSAESKRSEYVTPEPERNNNSWLWLVGLLVLGLIGWYFLRDSDQTQNAKEEVAATANEAATTATNAVSDAATAVGGKIDEFGNWLADLGPETTINLADGTSLVVGRNSSEHKLYQFITEGTIDESDKTKNWISLDRVFFETGKSVLTAPSAAQVKNIGAILKNYPNASLKIGGYTDNTGDAALNKKISTERAKIVGAELVKAGAAPKQIVETEGYGPEHPIASNDTNEGRAQNRRVDIKVASK